MIKDLVDVTKGLASATPNALTTMKSAVSVKRRGIRQASKDAAATAITSTNIVTAKITTNSDAQEEADRKNTFRLAVISVKDAIALSITDLVGIAITNAILRTADGTYFTKPLMNLTSTHYSKQALTAWIAHRRQALEGSLSILLQRNLTSGKN